MCSRYELNTTNLEHVSSRFSAKAQSGVPALPEIRPTNRVPVIKPGGHVEMLHWGLENPWNSKTLINARSETLAQKKTFIPLLENRCLVPASAYFEWRKNARPKIKTRIAPVDQDLMAFAGLFDDDRFTIITCVPSPAIAHIHGRMPVILERHYEQDWLTVVKPFAQVSKMLTPYPNGALFAQEVTRPPQYDLFV
ncbi:MAG: DUF159 family protein [Rhodospirillaceae bacterium]|nr:DUF159 family protein [Rhodospirillaceae bacterium]